jgi:hypothetical protein
LWGNPSFTPHLLACLFCSCDLTFTAASFTLAVSPSPFQFIFGLRSLLAEVMAEERSPLLNVVGDVLEVTWLETSVSSSSSEDSSGGGSSEDADVEAEAETESEKVVVVDPRESAQSYDFRHSTITVGRIRQLETLRYFVEGSAGEPGEETVLEVTDDEAIVFEEFFITGLRMPPHPALKEILLKYRVQLHQLTPNAFVQFSKYF